MAFSRFSQIVATAVRAGTERLLDAFDPELFVGRAAGLDQAIGVEQQDVAPLQPRALVRRVRLDVFGDS